VKYLGWIIGLLFIGIFILFYNFKYLPTAADLIKQTDENTMWQNQIQELKNTQKPFVYKSVFTFDDLFANPTSLNLSPKGESTLKVIIPELQALTGEIQVCGHTDNTPVNSVIRNKYPTNWEFSSARAVVVLRNLIKLGVKSERLVASGYGDTRPIEDNASEAGRKNNRRIEIMVINQ
jgi:flagellar motor protein MotB